MRIDNVRIERMAALIAALPEDDHGLNFYSFRVGEREVPAADMYPPLDHPAAIEFFFFVCLHNHGFWHSSPTGYLQPLVGYLGGKQCKGSDLLWKVCMRALAADPKVFSPKKLSVMSSDQLVRLFSDEHGPIGFEDMKHRLSITREYGRRMQQEVQTPAGIVAAANRSRTGEVLAEFLSLLQGTVGFGEAMPAYPGVAGYGDRLRKKSLLLAMALSSRPEKFLNVTDPQHWKPIVDYHVMRLALRSGLVELDESAAKRNAARRWVDAETEQHIRSLAYVAVERVMRRSKRSLAVVDHAFWSARRFCPEMEAPDCDKCAFNAACAKRVELFQPVYRTADY